MLFYSQKGKWLIKIKICTQIQPIPIYFFKDEFAGKVYYGNMIEADGPWKGEISEMQIKFYSFSNCFSFFIPSAPFSLALSIFCRPGQSKLLNGGIEMNLTGKINGFKIWKYWKSLSKSSREKAHENSRGVTIFLPS